MKLKKVLAGLMAAVTAVTASVCAMSVSAGAYADIDIWENYEVLKSGKKVTLTLEPVENKSNSETAIYKLPVGESGVFHMDISSDSYYVEASFVKKQVTKKADGSTSTRSENVDNKAITVSMKTGSCFNDYNGDVDFIWDESSRKSAGSCEFAVEPGEYFVGFTVSYSAKGMGEVVPFEKLKDEFGSGKVTIIATYPYDTSYSDKSNDNSTDDYSPYNIKYLGIEPIKNQYYTGKPVKPSVKIYYDIIDMAGNHIKQYLTNGKDYKISYKNNKKAGVATVTLTGIGEYFGTNETLFIIEPKKVTLTGKASGTKENLSWKKSAGATGYEVYRSVGGKFTKLTTTKALKYTAKLTAGKSYQFKVRPYAAVNGEKVYGSWSNVVRTK